MYAQIGMFVGAFLIPLFIAAIWLVVAKLFKLSNRTAYMVGMVVFATLPIVSLGYPSLALMMTQLLGIGLMYWQWKRADRKIGVQHSPVAGKKFKQQRPDGRGFVKAHWRGELPLVQSFWINTVALTAVMTLLITMWSEIGKFEARGELAALLIVIFLATFVIYPWQFVGAWRSASNHSRNGGSSSWSSAAQVLLILGLLRTIAEFGTTIPVWKQVFVNTAEIQKWEYSVEYNPNDSAIRLSGMIDFGMPEEIEDILKREHVTTIILDLGGGRIEQAREIADLVQSHNLDTVSFTGCLSACTLVYISGQERSLSKSATLGFHSYSHPLSQTYIPDLNYEIKENLLIEQDRDKKRFLDRGVEPQFIDSIYQAGSDGFWYPTREQLYNAGVITGEVLEHLVSTQSNEAVEYQEILNAFSQIELFQTIEIYDKEYFSLLTNSVKDMLNQGYSSQDITFKLQSDMIAYLMSVLPRASDDDVLNFYMDEIESAKFLRNKEPALCLKYQFPGVFGSLDLQSVLPSEMVNKKLNIRAQVVKSALTVENLPFDSDRAISLLTETVMLMDDQEISYLSPASGLDFDEYAPACNAMIGLFEKILALGKDDASEVLRYMTLASQEDIT